MEMTPREYAASMRAAVKHTYMVGLIMNIDGGSKHIPAEILGLEGWSGGQSS